MSENSTLTQAGAETAVAERRSKGTYRPRVDVRETDETYELIADVPGAGEEDIDLSIEKDVLTLTARVEQPRFEGYEPFWRGYGVGDWSRSFRISDAVEREGIEATVKDGVLRVTLPKGKASLKTPIAVKRAD